MSLSATDSSEFSLPDDLVGQASKITSREIRQLQMMNRVLVDKLILVQGELKQLREKRGADEGRVMGTSSSTDETNIPDVPPDASSSIDVHLEQCNPIVNPSQSPMTSSEPRILTVATLPHYSHYLPPIDRTILGEEFYADLQDKRIIPGYDTERWSCWCHVAKSAKGSKDSLSIQHSGSGKDKPYRVSRWFQHAGLCDFYKNPWAMDERGERLFAQFPLDNPRRGPEQGTSSALAVPSPPDNNLQAPQIASETAPQMLRVYTATDASAPHAYVQTAPLPSYSPYLPPIDRTRTGKDFFIHLRDAKIIAGLTQTRFSCWCHRAKDEEQGVTPGSNSKSHSDAHVAERSSGGRYRVSKFFEHARSCNFYKNSWATNGMGERVYPQFPLEKVAREPEQESVVAAVASTTTIDSNYADDTPSPVTASQFQETSHNPTVSRYTIPQYSLGLPAIDRTQSGESFFAHLQDGSIIAGYDDTHFFCWCHVAKDTEKGVYRGSHGKLHADARVDQGQGQGPRYRMSMFFEHAKTCNFFKNPWATKQGTGERLFPQFPLENPARQHGQEQESAALATLSANGNQLQETHAPTTATGSQEISSNLPGYILPHYSAYLPPIDQSKTGEEFFAHLRNEMISSSYDSTRFSCWCHIAKDVEKGVVTGSHGKSHADAYADRRRYKVSMFYEHARKCNFYMNPWATSGLGGKGDRLYPQFPLEKPDQPMTGFAITVDSPTDRIATTPEDSLHDEGRSLRKRKKVRYDFS